MTAAEESAKAKARKAAQAASEAGSDDSEDTDADDTKDILQALSHGVTQLLKGMEDLTGRVSGLESSTKKNADEIDRVKTGDRDAFKREAKEEDIETASANRKGVDARICAIVDDTVGTDFGIEISALGDDQVGYMFTLTVPDRLNDNPVEQRPILESEGVYKKDALGNVLMEPYKRPDRRSRKLATSDGYTAIREHCEKVRAYIVAYYSALKKPQPELKVR